jgi:hypothetical protein
LAWTDDEYIVSDNKKGENKNITNNTPSHPSTMGVSLDMLISKSSNDTAIHDDSSVTMKGQSITLKQNKYNGLGFDGKYFFSRINLSIYLSLSIYLYIYISVSLIRFY